MTTAQTDTHYDVIISGAGPVGLFLACELALAKCSVLILERAIEPRSILKRAPFGIRGLSAPSIDALYRRGLLSAFDLHKQVKSPHSDAMHGTRRQVGHFAGIPFYDEDVDPGRWEYRLHGSPPSMITQMEEIETIFTQRATALGVQIRRGHAVESLYQDDHKVTVTAADDVFTAKWLVGCDGSRSAVRKLAGFEFAGTEPQFTGYSAMIDIADPEKLRQGRVITSGGMYMVSQANYVIIQDFDGGVFHDAKQPATRDHIQAVRRRISETDVTIDTLHAATTWTDRSRQAAEYRTGRILLAGDAAHIHSPLGGQGLNLGLGDAMNLGWKLASVIKGYGPDVLLHSYFRERHPVGAQVLNWSRAQVALMQPDPHARALNAVIRDLMKTVDGATYFAERVWGISMRYDLGADHPLMGRSMPDLEFEDGTRAGDLMHDGKGLLISFQQRPSLQNMAARFGGRILYVTGTAIEQFGSTAILVRPDGIIAWVSTAEPDEEELLHATKRWFG